MTTSQKIERFAKALREAQLQTSAIITPENEIVVWNDYDMETICGFKVYRGTTSGPTIITKSDNYNVLRCIRIFEDMFLT